MGERNREKEKNYNMINSWFLKLTIKLKKKKLYFHHYKY